MEIRPWMIVLFFIIGVLVTMWVYDDPRCLIANCTIVK